MNPKHKTEQREMHSCIGWLVLKMIFWRDSLKCFIKLLLWRFAYQVKVVDDPDEVFGGDDFFQRIVHDLFVEQGHRHLASLFSFFCRIFAILSLIFVFQGFSYFRMTRLPKLTCSLTFLKKLSNRFSNW